MATKKQAKKEPTVAMNRATLEEIRALGGDLKAGRLDRRANTATAGGRELLEEVNAIVDTLTAPLGLAIGQVAQLGRGELPDRLTAACQGEFAKLQDGLNALIDTTRMRQADIEMLLAASVEGKLETRADIGKYKDKSGAFIEAINDMLDAILLPIGEGNRILAQISAGKIDELIAHTYKGDHEKMKQAVNNVAIVLQSSAEGIDPPDRRLRKHGELSERGKPEQFQGAYADIVRGVNTMLDAILLPIGEGNRILAQISNGQDR